MSTSIIIGVSHKTYFGYGQTRQWCREVAEHIHNLSLSGSGIELFTFPAMPAIGAALAEFSTSVMQVGAQNVCMAPAGAWTGETSASMLEEMGCRYVEIGHAERRRHFGETVGVINQKLDMAFAHQLTPVICIGEEYEMAPRQAAEFALTQAEELLAHRSGKLPALIFAWEPQWAIGAPAPASDDYIREVCKTLRQRLQQQYGPQCRVIYGGSAGPGLIGRLWPDVDGIFLGRFAHSPSAMAEILTEAKALLHT
ncbi:triose-phosphate isomerase [Pluralibacter gergoviae]|uniref:triose-phosphate isomerase family protein n=1 Tax=Pluralibacter gergoviae TaxID=61647 RepID=UPI0005EBF57A|nr:triose-phosphate isomerase family protein [Pluralibacter gergoviae]KJM63075.1 triosephosphate isomerase [Pluralibacter gergoviae]OUR00993.1 triose-phosphate isomerase [Pluralibacter gergoviae]